MSIQGVLHQRHFPDERTADRPFPPFVACEQSPRPRADVWAMFSRSDGRTMQPRPDDRPPHPRTDEQPTHSPPDVGACSTPLEYYTAMRRSRGRICVRFDDPDLLSVVRYVEPFWERYDRPPTRGRGVVVRLDRAGVLASLRLGRPALVTHDEVRHLFAAARHRSRTRRRADSGGDAPVRRRERRFRDWHAVQATDDSSRTAPRDTAGREGPP